MTTWILTAIAISGAVLLAPPILLFAAEVFIACIVRRGLSRPLVASSPRTAILIPAHNEEAGIGEMLRALFATLRNNERVVVVADNCNDRTVAIARACGAEVLERHNLDRRGKGWALEFGVEHLSRKPPEVLVVLDADCTVSEQTVERLANEARQLDRPVQGRYLCYAPAGGDAKSAISALAFQFKNQIRPLGMATIGGPAYLTGSGFALPWQLVAAAPWGSGNLVEDMQLGIDFALAGHSPAFLDEVEILSPLPAQDAVAQRQRTRWEHGQLATMLGQCPGLFAASVRQRRLDLLLLAFDLAVPPLALLAAAWLAIGLVTLIFAAFTGHWLAAQIVAAEGGLLAAAVIAGWFCFGRKTVPLRTLFRIPGYVLGKFGIYRGFVTARQAEWVRTERPTS